MRQSISRVKISGLGMLVAAGILLSSCGTTVPSTAQGERLTFDYTVPTYIDSAWIFTHDASGNLLDSREVSGSGKVSIRGLQDGLITLFARDTGTKNGQTADFAVFTTYPITATENKILRFSTYPWLESKDSYLVSFSIACPPGASRIVVRGNLTAWGHKCESPGETHEIRAKADALARLSNGKLGAVVWAFDQNGPIAYVLLKEFDPNTTVHVSNADWKTDFRQSELRVAYESALEAQKHELGYSMTARHNGGWYALDTPGSYNQNILDSEVVLPEAYAPLTSLDQVVLWFWSIKTITPNTEGAASILLQRSNGIPTSTQLSFSKDFAPYPDYVEWDYTDQGRIWVKTNISPPSTPIYYYAVVRSNKGSAVRQWSMVLYGDHRQGGVFPELPSQMQNLTPSKQNVDVAMVGNDIGATRWLSSPWSSFAGDKAWYVWRWKYVVGSETAQLQSLKLNSNTLPAPLGGR